MAKIEARVLIIIDTEKIGGPGKGLLSFLEYSKKNKFNFILCNFFRKGRRRGEGEFNRESVNKGINIELLNQFFSYDPSPIWRADRLILENNINIIQTHGYKADVLGFFLKKMSQKPWIGFAHGYTNENIKVRLYNKLDRFVLRYPDIVLTVSDSLKRRIMKSGVPERKIRIIYNAIDKDEIRSDLLAEEVKRKYGIMEGEKIVGVVGRLSPEKGQLVFLEAFKKVVEKVATAKAIIIGDGQEKGRLTNFCRNNGLGEKIIFTGYQNNIANFYQIMDLLVLPSLSEGLPNVLLEAMAFKIPVIATSVGGVPEVIMDKQNGLLIPVGSPDIMADRIVGLLNNNSVLKKIGENGYQSLYPKFSPQNRAFQILSVYEEFLS